jgi:5-methylcytosine-specific restriction endonuclease McrA
MVKARLRKLKIKEATPLWLSKEQKAQIADFYKKAKIFGLVVDHIVPLKGTGVNGLHVPWNLQLLTDEENKRKSNKYVRSC